jgi:hypothetical protein
MTAYKAEVSTYQDTTLRLEAKSHLVREQVLDLYIGSHQVDPDVDTVRIVVHPENGRPRSIVMSRDSLRSI